MPSKQELMDMMDNRLPGETLYLSDPPAQPPAYPDLQSSSYSEQQRIEQQQQQQQQQQQLQQQQLMQPVQEQIYTIRQPAITLPPPQFGSRSHLAYCPSCHATEMTRCDYESNMTTHIIATILCFTTCCCCLPYCFDSCKGARHYCQNCGSYLGSHN